MNLKVETNSSRKQRIKSFDEKAALKIINKGWSFSYVYNFEEIKDVFLVLKEYGFNDLSSFTEICKNIELPYARTPWNKRRILEHLNALKNFELISSDYEIKRDVFQGNIGSKLTPIELNVFHKIFFSYFRFKELLHWFIDIGSLESYEFTKDYTEAQLIGESKILFSFSTSSRFTDSFFYDLSPFPEIYEIDKSSGEDLMRFWDVFIKWGTTLKVLEKINLKGINITTDTHKAVNCLYLIRQNSKFDLLEYLQNNSKTGYIYLPELVLDLALNLRIEFESVKQLIIDEYKKNKEYLSFERTSEIFIKKSEINEKDKIFFPKYNDSFISHLILRK